MSIHIEHHPLYQATCAERDALKAELMNEKACHTMDLASRDTEIGMLKAELAAVKELSELRLKSEQKYAWESLDIRAEIGTLKSLLGKERDEFGKKETEMKAEISKLKAELEDEKDELKFHSEAMSLLESRAAKYREALEKIAREPLGHSEATYKEVFAIAEQIAKEALKELPEKYEETLKKFLVKGQEAEA